MLEISNNLPNFYSNYISPLLSIRGNSKEKLYQELGLESLPLRRWYRKLQMFYKIYKNKSPQYLFKLIPEKTHAYATRNVDNIPCFKIRHNFFKNSFFPSTIIEWNNLDPTLRNSKSFVDFKNSILKFIRPSPSNVFNCNNHKGIRLITRLRVGRVICVSTNLNIIFKIV